MRKALIVEDEQPIRELLRLHLELAGCALDEASDGRQGLERSRSTPNSLILLDLMLPGLDGEADKVLGLESGAGMIVERKPEARPGTEGE